MDYRVGDLHVFKAAEIQSVEKDSPVGDPADLYVVYADIFVFDTAACMGKEPDAVKIRQVCILMGIA